MNMMVPAYSAAEIDAIAGWLGEEFSASEIANRLSALRRLPVTRNAIIGIVHRNKRLAAIGFGHKPFVIRAAPTEPAPPRQPKINAGNIRAKKEGRALDPVFSPPRPRLIDDGIAPEIYDAAARHVDLDALKPGECRWPVNSAARGEQHLFCGQSSGLAIYCPHHCRRAGSGYRAEQTRDVRSALKRSA